MENNEELKTLEDQKPAEPTAEELKNMIVELVKVHPDFESGRLSRCHPYKCPLAWMWPMWHPTPPHIPLYPTDWC